MSAACEAEADVRRPHRAQAPASCTEDGCQGAHEARGLCRRHYRKRLDAGTLPPRALTYAEGNEDHFWARVDRSGDCWQWTGSIAKSGYGNVRLQTGVNGYAHRVAYELTHGAIPEGLVIDHLCRNRACVNPEHLEAVENGENTRRGAVPYGRLHTRCKRGHDVTDPANVYTRPSGYKHCRVCSRESKQRSTTKKEMKS